MYERLAASPGMAQALIDAGMEIDVTHVTPPIPAPRREHRDAWLTARARSLLRFPIRLGRLPDTCSVGGRSLALSKPHVRGTRECRRNHNVYWNRQVVQRRQALRTHHA